MTQPSTPSPGIPSDEVLADRLDSWKDVAAYLKRDISTVQRWEKREGMPVHRHRHDKAGSVYAFRSELATWWWSRQQNLQHGGRGAEAGIAVDSGAAERSSLRRFGGWALAAGLIAVGTAGVALYMSRWTKGAVPIASLVVLPLENLSADPEQEFFADGMTEELTSRLAEIRALRVVSKTSARRAKGSKKTLSEIGRDLDVDAVLEGSVQRSGGFVRIRIQLLHTRTDAHVWAHAYERPLADVLRLEADVARSVVDEIRVQLTPEERTRIASTHVASPAAHIEYLLGRYHLWKYIDQDRALAIDHFERAVRLAPGYAAPYAALAHAWWTRGVMGPLSLREVEGPARAAAREALKRDDRLAEAYAALAYLQGVFDWDWTRAEATVRHALELDPGSVDTHYIYAVLLMALGRHRDAIGQIGHAAALDPLSAQVQSTFGRILYRARRFDEALQHLGNARELEPRNAQVHGRLGDVYAEMGGYAQAIAAYEKAQALMAEPGSDYVNRIARVYARMGRAYDARHMVRISGARSAAVDVALGDKDAAFVSLFRMVDERTDWPIFIKADPPFDTLHSDRRWNQLLARMNLPVEDEPVRRN